MADILGILTNYYGLDWLALIFGISGSYLITNQNRMGFLLCCAGCLCGFTVAAISAQFGFVMYNVILTAIMIRGYINLSRYQNHTRSEPAE